MNQGLIVLAMLCDAAIILGIDAIKWNTKEMRELRKNHPERFDKCGRFIPYKTGSLCRPNLPMNAPNLPPSNK